MKSRQGSCWRVAMAIAFFIAVSIAVLGANPFARQTVGPYDLLVAAKGWNQDHGPVEVRNRERTDILDAMVPRWMFARGELRQGRLPLWNPLPGGGEPGIHNLASAQLSPAFAIFAAAPSPASGFYFATLFNLAMAGIGAWFWLRRSVGTMPAVFGGVTVMLCGFHAAWLYWPHMSTAVWVCWLLWAVEGCWRSTEPWRFAALAAITALMLLGGFPFVAELGLGAAVLFALVLWRLAPEPGGAKRLMAILGTILLGFGLVAIPLLSFVDWLAQVDTAARSGGSSLRLLPDALRLLPHVARQAPAVESQMYVGGLALPLAIVALLRWAKPRQVSPLLAFGSLLLIISLVLVFELVPRAWLEWVPGLGSNGWSRSIFALDVALAALAACGLARVLQWARSRWSLALLAIPLLAVQTVDLGSMFRRFNGSVPAAWMFPVTPQIAQAQAGLVPFNYVIADYNYIVSGSLGAYGLADWYGHGFKSAAVKKLLAQAVRDPFTTPTASVLEARALRLHSPVMRAMGVRYVLGDEQLVALSLMPDYPLGPAPMEALPALGTASWVQYVDLGEPFNLTDVELRIATYGGTALHGTVTLSVSDPAHPQQVLAEATVPAGALVDGDMARFHFSPSTALRKGRYALRLRHDGAAVDENITAWYRPGSTSNCSLLVEPAHTPGCLIMRLLSQRSDLDGWQIAAHENGLVLLESLNTPAGPYFLASLNDAPTARSADAIRAEGSFSQGWTLHYTGSQAGYVVLPMAASRSWVITVDGLRMRPQQYLGALPAVSVHGATVVTARYEPDSVRNGLWITMASALMLIAAVAVLHRRRRTAARRSIASRS